MSVKTPVSISKNGMPAYPPSIIGGKNEVLKAMQSPQGWALLDWGPCLPLPHGTHILVKPGFGPTVVSTHYNKICPMSTI